MTWRIDDDRLTIKCSFISSATKYSKLLMRTTTINIAHVYCLLNCKVNWKYLIAFIHRRKKTRRYVMQIFCYLLLSFGVCFWSKHIVHMCLYMYPFNVAIRQQLKARCQKRRISSGKKCVLEFQRICLASWMSLFLILLCICVYYLLLSGSSLFTMYGSSRAMCVWERVWSKWETEN